MNWLASLFLRGAAPAEGLDSAQQAALANWLALPPVSLDLPHARQRYVIVDVETSGLDMRRDRLIAIGALGVTDGMIDFSDAFQVVLRQTQASTTDNILIHGIGASEQGTGVAPVDALLAFLAFVGKSPLVAYHAFFDQAMIEKASRQYLGVRIDLPFIDLAWVLPDLVPNSRDDGRVALDDWLARFGIANIQRHNAVSDAYATACLLQIACARASAKGADTAASLTRIERARRWMFESR